MKRLLDAGADANAVDDSWNGKGRTALHCLSAEVPAGPRTSAMFESIDLPRLVATVDALVDGGADVNYIDANGRTPLMVAACALSHLVEHLLRLGADHTVVAAGGQHMEAWSNGKTALELAEEKGQHASANLLRQWAADHPNVAYEERSAAKNKRLQNAELRNMAAAGNTAEVRRLLEAGADPNDTDDVNCETAVILAAQRAHGEVVAMLVAGGADLNAADRNGETLLMRAATGRGGAVRELLALGADHTVVAAGGLHKGKTALEMAEEGLHEERKYKGSLKKAADDHLKDWKKLRLEVVTVLRDWAAAHPNADYDARVVARDRRRREEELQKDRLEKDKVKVHSKNTGNFL